jgi:hypothetical protein
MSMVWIKNTVQGKQLQDCKQQYNARPRQNIYQSQAQGYYAGEVPTNVKVALGVNTKPRVMAVNNNGQHQVRTVAKTKVKP